MTFAMPRCPRSQNTACKARSAHRRLRFSNHQIIENVGASLISSPKALSAVPEREETRARSIAGRMPFLTRISKNFNAKFVQFTAGREHWLCHFSMAFIHRRPSGPQKPLSVFPLIVALSPTKSGEPRHCADSPTVCRC